MLEQKHLLGQWRYRGSDDKLRAAFVHQVQVYGKRTGRRFPSVELHCAVLLWLQRRGCQLQWEPADIVVNRTNGDAYARCSRGPS